MTASPIVLQPRLRLPLLDQVLEDQQRLTAVERFAEKHASCAVPRQAKYYRDLIPLERPRPGQQYAFEVDMDSCTGCKACVAACHSLNGLDEGEAWRTVGLLHGGSVEHPAQQTVTTSCHHCVDPACLSGCPVKAYEKDPVTGIVRHLDDQCIGCQYCTLMCPYDAPKYNRARGIVRKCDMCSDRLGSGEAPACVQGCPNQAISIRVVDQRDAVEAGQAGAFLTGAPAPSHTNPTTVYRSVRPAPESLAPADLHRVRLEDAHPPLVVMLLLTQLSVGLLAFDFVARRLLGVAGGVPALVPAAVAFATALLALGAATFHLGRPRYAFRAVLGLRTSWMSREVLAFGLYAKATALYALACLPHLPAFLPALPGKAFLGVAVGAWQGAAVTVGAAGVLSSVMIYVATRRAHWRARVTGFEFTTTALLLGAAALLALDRSGLAARALLAAPREARCAAIFCNSLLAGVVALSAFKLAREAATIRRRHGRRQLRAVLVARFAASLAGMTALAWPWAKTGWVAFGLLAAGELAERYLFFRAAPPSRMPGALS